MYCSVCECHHKATEFGTRQRRKSAAVRVCKNPKSPAPVMYFSSYGDYADYLEFGRSRYFATEIMEAMYDSD